MISSDGFRKLKVWQKAHTLALEVYRLTAKFPDSERYGLISQMRRAAVSVVANIVEGTKRRTVPDRRHFYAIAAGSLEECKYYFILSADLGFLQQHDAEMLSDTAQEVGAMLYALTRSIGE